MIPWILLGLTIFLILVWACEEYDRRKEKRAKMLGK